MNSVNAQMAEVNKNVRDLMRMNPQRPQEREAPEGEDEDSQNREGAQIQ